MRMSRVLLAGAAVAAAGIATSAFTAGNDIVVDDNVAGYGAAEVTGIDVSNIAYNPDSDVSKLANVVFTVNEDTTNLVETMTLYKLATPGPPATTEQALAAPSTCNYTGDGAAAHSITCVLGTPVDFQAFDKIGLTVVSQ